MGEGRTRVFCSKALFTKARYMSFRRRSPRLILEFVAIGRERSPSSSGMGDLEGSEEDNFLEAPRDWRVRGDRVAKPSNEGDFG